MLVVSDTSPINYLVLMRQETLLPTLYERVVIPPAVHEELQRSQTPEEVRQWIAHPPVWLSVQRPQQPLPLRPPVAIYRARLTPLNGPTAGRYTARRRGAARLR